MDSPRWLRVAQDGFVIWVLLGAFWGLSYPDTASAGRAWIPEMLALVMLGMGLTLTRKDLLALKSAGRPVILGVCLQFLIMPLGAWLLALVLGLPREIALGIILVGAAPGGTASNVVTFLARGDVGLSVAMTTASTLLSPVLTPLWVWLLASSWIPIDPLSLFLTVTKIVLLPVLAGMVIRYFWRPCPWLLDGLLPLLSMAVITWIVGVITALNRDSLAHIGAETMMAVAALNLAGLILGYGGAMYAKLSRRRARTVAIEVGMQNSGLAVAIAVAHFGPQAALTGALFSIWHNVTGPLLASIWRRSS
jgi:BASS family bile acid:Na+ symporter